MSWAESALCRSGAWRVFERRVLLPWAVPDGRLVGEALEVGAGAGGAAAELLRANPELRLTVTDFDPRMVHRARRRLGAFGDRARVLAADASALPFPDGSFDAAFSFLMLHHVGRWEDALAELVRVLRPGGRLIGCDALGRSSSDSVQRLFGTGDERLAREAELARELGALPLVDVALETTLRRRFARFSGGRAA
jgi:SAM-dependent methyltransferase